MLYNVYMDDFYLCVCVCRELKMNLREIFVEFVELKLKKNILVK